MKFIDDKLISVEDADIINGEYRLPDFISHIENRCFFYNRKLTNIDLNSVKTIGSDSFAGCHFTSLEIPDSVEYIAQGAFQLCKELKTLKLPKSMKVLAKEVFGGCSFLEEVTLPENLEIVGDKSFWGCRKISKIDLPKSVTKIGKTAFGNCRRLQEITLPEGIESLEEYAFQSCGFKTINLPESITFIGKSCFDDCEELEEVIIPSKIKYLEDTFDECNSLERVYLPEGLIGITRAFMECPSLKKIELPRSVQYVEGAFINCKNLEEVSFYRDCKFLDNLHGKTDYITLQGEKIVLSKDKIDDKSFFMGDGRGLHVGVILSLWDKKEEIIKRVRNNRDDCYMFNKLYEVLTEEQFVDLYNNGNFKFFRNMMQEVGSSDIASYYKLCYNLGAFQKRQVYLRENKKQQIVEEDIDFSQKVCEFLKEAYITEQVKRENNKDYKTMFQEISLICSSMSCQGFKREFTEFFMNNFEELLQEERNEKGFIARCYNLFDEVQKTNTSNKGKQRQLKPTIEKFKMYFEEKKYVGENEQNKAIAETIKPYFSSQTAFDSAVAIEEERVALGTGSRILSQHVKEQDVFATIDEYTERIKESAVDSLYILTELANKVFTFEFLEKNDPRNYILGKLCSNCAHLEGVGYGIMRASIVHPDVQNIVITDKKGEIVAKTTIYVNREEGYAVCNTFGVGKQVDYECYPIILEKFKMALTVFAETYNAENEIPLKQINVGLGMNDLEEFLTEDKSLLTPILKSLNYGHYGKGGLEWAGDSQNGQAIIWQKQDSEDEYENY